MPFAIAIAIGLLVGALYKRFAPKRGKWGVNPDYRNTTCPVCGLKAPALRIPKNKEEWLWGGWTCKKCGSHLDKYGVEKNRSTSEKV